MSRDRRYIFTWPWPSRSISGYIHGVYVRTTYTVYASTVNTMLSHYNVVYIRYRLAVIYHQSPSQTSHWGNFNFAHRQSPSQAASPAPHLLRLPMDGLLRPHHHPD